MMGILPHLTSLDPLMKYSCTPGRHQVHSYSELVIEQRVYACTRCNMEDNHEVKEQKILHRMMAGATLPWQLECSSLPYQGHYLIVAVSQRSH